MKEEDFAKMAAELRAKGVLLLHMELEPKEFDELVAPIWAREAWGAAQRVAAGLQPAPSAITKLTFLGVSVTRGKELCPTCRQEVKP